MRLKRVTRLKALQVASAVGWQCARDSGWRSAVRRRACGPLAPPPARAARRCAGDRVRSPRRARAQVAAVMAARSHTRSLWSASGALRTPSSSSVPSAERSTQSTAAWRAIAPAAWGRASRLRSAHFHLTWRPDRDSKETDWYFAALQTLDSERYGWGVQLRLFCP